MEKKISETKNSKSISKPKKFKWNIALTIEDVVNTIKGSELSFKKTEKYKLAMERLAEFFKQTDSDVIWILCMVTWYNFRRFGRYYDYCDLLMELDCSPLRAVSWPKKINKLADEGYLDLLQDDFEFRLTDEMLDAVVDNSEIKLSPQKNKIDNVTFVTHVGEVYEERRRCDKTTRKLLRELSNYENKHNNIPFVKDAINEIDSLESRVMFYDMCKDFLHGGESNLSATVADLYDNGKRFAVCSDLMNGKHILVKKNLIEFSRKGNISDATIILTEKGRQLFLGENAALFEKQINEKLLIKAEDIKVKKLFYSKENTAEINRLKEALSKDNLPKIQQRLKENAMPSGVAVLLYGAPGTGKTESVYQIAKATGRAIVHVDISDTKSAWFGESEKLIKEVFVKYRGLCELSEKKGAPMPILLFNEADAVIGKRKSNTSSSVAQTENAIQNIILEELENLNGIMIATTNLAENLDSAFERRFLFKIKYENPSVEAKVSIWKSKLKWLTKTDAEILASRFDFSGGQIDNIVRKLTMDEIITGNRASIDEIVDICKNEKINKDDERKLGFAV